MSDKWNECLDELTELLEKRRVCDIDIQNYIDVFMDEKPLMDFATFRDTELFFLDEKIIAGAVALIAASLGR